VGEKVSRGLREMLLKKSMGMDMAWFEVDCPDVSSLYDSSLEGHIKKIQDQLNLILT
jgi:hypothetical protein